MLGKGVVCYKRSLNLRMGNGNWNKSGSLCWFGPIDYVVYAVHIYVIVELESSMICINSGVHLEFSIIVVAGNKLRRRWM